MSKAKHSIIDHTISYLTPRVDKYDPYSGIIPFRGIEYKTEYDNSGVAVAARITKVDINSIVESIIDENYIDPIASYSVDRILRASKLKDPNRWSADIHSGYYNERYVGKTHPEQEIIDKLVSTLKAMIGLSDIDKVKACLKEEYGYILPQIQPMNTATIIKVPTNSILMAAENYIRRLEKEYVDQYDTFRLPRGIVLKEGKDQYRLLDGYHRCMSALNQNLNKVKVIELSKA